jgi:hypothetical protein
MADNVTLPAASGKAAAREITYSGETAQAQAVGLVTFEGADDAKTATDVSEANPLPVADDAIAQLLSLLLMYQDSPRGYDNSLKRQRGTVIVESGTVTTVTTVSTVTNVTNLNNIDGYNGRMQVLGQNQTAWQACVRARIT